METEDVSDNNQLSIYAKIFSPKTLFFFALSGLILYGISRYNYLIGHIFIEFSIVMIGILIFSVSYISHGMVKKNLFILLGPGFLMTSIAALLHTLTFKGMNLIPGYDTDLATQLWIVLSYTLALSFLFSVTLINKPINYRVSLVATSAVSLLLIVLSFLDIFPDCYIEGEGLTAFKRISEYVIIVIYALSLYGLYRERRQYPQYFLQRMVSVIALLMLSGFLFTLYQDVYGIFNIMGHLVRVLAYYIIYTALLNDLILLPYKEILYDSTHDKLTGLYNRNFLLKALDEKWTRPGIIVFDINGLKLINETFGFEAGDKLICLTGGIVRNGAAALPDGSSVSYMGSGEFVLIINDADKQQMELVLKKTIDAKEKYNIENPDLPLHFSYALVWGEEPNLDSTGDLFKVYRKAHENLNMEKLLNSSSKRNTIVKTLMKTLESKDSLTKDHADRTAQLAVELAILSGVPENRMNMLVLLAEFHDIGKIGISDSILNKPGKLTTEERITMQQHSKIGYEIAIASMELAPISDFILKHHEQWDGRGYPFGLVGDQTPLECRIISIVDAYDAMMNDRPYRKGMIHAEAVAEMLKFSGTQFDPNLVKLFLKIVGE